MTPDRHLLLEILSFARPHKSETEKRFAREFLDTIPGMARDGFGNRHLDIGDNPRAMWSCHIDTVASKGGSQLLSVSPSGLVSLANGKAGMSLGADDGAGVWIMLEMIRAKRPGRYVFHRGEELGCLGSRHILTSGPSLLKGLDFAIAFDRRGTDSIITHQQSGRTASDEFAQSMADVLNMTRGFAFGADSGGIYTDTDTYSGVVPECSNLGVGYEGNHGPRETLDMPHCERLLEAMLCLEVADLVVARDPSVPDFDDYTGFPAWSSGWTPSGIVDPDGLPFGEVDDMADMVRRYPVAAARLMLEAGIIPADLACEHFALTDH